MTDLSKYVGDWNEAHKVTREPELALDGAPVLTISGRVGLGPGKFAILPMNFSDLGFIEELRTFVKGSPTKRAKADKPEASDDGE